jgi:hypothetical protein
VMRFSKLAKSWSVLEITSAALISLLAYQVSLEVGGDPYVSLIFSSIILSKYVHISDISLLMRGSFLSVSCGLSEILSQLWLGIHFFQVSFHPSSTLLVPAFALILISSNLLALALGYLCKLKTIKLKDCVCMALAGIRGVPSVVLLSLCHPDVQGLATVSCLLFSLCGVVLSLLIRDSKDETSYLISSNPCSKLKSLLQNIDESYIMPVFLKETRPVSISSPKFNEGSQRFDAGIQMRPDPRDDTSRDLQALNLNITESELQGALQLK